MKAIIICQTHKRPADMIQDILVRRRISRWPANKNACLVTHPATTIKSRHRYLNVRYNNYEL